MWRKLRLKENTKKTCVLDSCKARSLVMHDKGEKLCFNLLPTEDSDSSDARNTDSDDWLNTAFRFPPEGFDLEKAILRLIEMGIDQSSGNVSEAARLLGVPRDYLRYRLQKKDE